MPRLTGRTRFSVGPSSTTICFSQSWSRASWWLCSAFAAADLMAFATSTAACFGENSSCASASTTRMPRTRSATRRALRGARRMYRARASTSFALPRPAAALRPSAGVAAEVTGGRELAELVPDHVLADEHGNVLAAVVDRDRVPDHLGEDRRRPGPGADHPLVARGVQPCDLVREALVDVRPFLE